MFCYFFDSLKCVNKIKENKREFENKSQGLSTSSLNHLVYEVMKSWGKKWWGNKIINNFLRYYPEETNIIQVGVGNQAYREAWKMSKKFWRVRGMEKILIQVVIVCVCEWMSMFSRVEGMTCIKCRLSPH